MSDVVSLMKSENWPRSNPGTLIQNKRRIERLRHEADSKQRLSAPSRNLRHGNRDLGPVRSRPRISHRPGQRCLNAAIRIAYPGLRNRG
jgi:hypothetical protein